MQVRFRAAPRPDLTLTISQAQAHFKRPPEGGEGTTGLGSTQTFPIAHGGGRRARWAWNLRLTWLWAADKIDWPGYWSIVAVGGIAKWLKGLTWETGLR